MELVYAYIQLVPYWVDTRANRVRWTACEECLTSSVRRYFTRVTKGWEDSDGVGTDYELVERVDKEDRDTMAWREDREGELQRERLRIKNLLEKKQLARKKLQEEAHQGKKNKTRQGKKRNKEENNNETKNERKQNQVSLFLFSCF